MPAEVAGRVELTESPMNAPLLFVTGFEPYLDARFNPSGELARLLALQPPPGVEIVGEVLPVSFTRTPPAYARALERLDRRPVALLALGLHRDSWFRLERRARRVLDSLKPDAEGLYAKELEPLGEEDLATDLDLAALSAALVAGGAGEVRVSDDAGGYICEQTYHGLLRRAEEWGIGGLFLHVPPAEKVAVEDQLGPVTSLVRELLRQAAGRPEGSPGP